MLNILNKGYLVAMAIKLLDNYRQLSIQFLKIEAVKSYLHGVRLARLSVLGILCLVFLIGLICVGVIIFHAGLFLLLPWTLKAKAFLGLVLGAVYMSIGALALMMLMDEKRWMRHSGATAMIMEVTRPARKG